MNKENKKIVYQLGGLVVLGLALYGMGMALKVMAPAYLAQKEREKK
jgi:hypothetical protein